MKELKERMKEPLRIIGIKKTVNDLIDTQGIRGGMLHFKDGTKVIIENYQIIEVSDTGKLK